MSYLFACFDASNPDQSITSPFNSLSNHISRLSLSLCTNNIRLTFLLSLLSTSFLEGGVTFSTVNRARSASCWAICFCSTARVNSLPKVIWVIETSSSSMLNSFARFNKSSRIRDETYTINPQLVLDRQFLAAWSTRQHRIEQQSISTLHFQSTAKPSHHNPTQDSENHQHNPILRLTW